MIAGLAVALVVGVLATARADAASDAEAPTHNGFALAPSSVAPEEILAGGPPRDGIPALTNPAALGAGSAPWSDDEYVLSLEWNGEARAYPLAILNWHQVVNDVVGGLPVLVSYCPLSGTALVFERRLGEQTRTFGVSGLVYRSDLLLYDQETQSLWSQIASRAVTGPANGTRLRVLRSEVARFGDWKAKHPTAQVLSPKTGFPRDYQSSPLGDYAESPRAAFPVPLDRRYHPKSPTLGLRIASGAARAYLAEELVRAGGRVDEEFEGRRVGVAYDPERQVFEVAAPEDVEVIEGYWFAWAAFHAGASVFRATPP